MALSILWAPAATPSVDETIRDVSYAAVVLALLLVVRRRTVSALLVGAFAGIVIISSYALLTRLHPDWVGSWDPALGYRLSGTIGYWNGLGVYAAMGVLLALGLVARSGSRMVQAFAGAAPPFLLVTMLFTFSRGAWLALAVGLVAAVLLDARRLQLLAAGLVLAPWVAAVILLAVRSDHLTKNTLTLQQAADEGGGLLLWIVVMAVASALAAVAFRLVNARLDVPAPVRRTIGGLTLAGIAVAIVAAFAVYGAPWTLAASCRRLVQLPRRSRREQTSRRGCSTSPRVVVSTRGASRSTSSGIIRWQAAARAASRRPGTCTGRARCVVRDAHSLYVEVLGELGAVGLTLLVLALGVPLMAAVRARRRPLVTGAFAMYAAFLAHAAVDWDWELAGVTLVGLIAAVALVVSARGEEADAEPGPAIRFGLPALTGAIAVLALAAVLSTVPLNQARRAYLRLDFKASATQAQKAVDWAPWSSEALDLLGRAQMGQGQLGKARLSFQRAVEKSPNDWELWRDLAAASPPAQARVALRRAQKAHPLESELIATRAGARSDAVSRL